jgi:threonylcarbamoyladenosine tRNA methylthiotransferase CDKAL1
MPNKVYLDSIDLCDRREVDKRRVANYLLLNGYEIAHSPDKADIVLVSTCAFNDNKEKRSIDRIEQHLKMQREVFVLGCLPGINEGFLKKRKLKGISPSNLSDIEGYFPGEAVRFDSVKDVNEIYVPSAPPIAIRRLFSEFEFNRLFFGKVVRFARMLAKKKDNNFFVRICNGCLSQCAFCVIHKATGRLKSKPLEDIGEEVRAGLTKGYSDFWLIGEDTGAYGADIKKSLPELLSMLNRMGGHFRVKISNCNPQWLIKHRGPMLSELERVSYIEIPIESASQRVLGLMNRGYRIEEFGSVVASLKRKKPSIKLYTALIAGFPTETQTEFMDSIKFAARAGFDTIAVFAYSNKQGSKGFSLKQTGKEEIWSRIKLGNAFLRGQGYIKAMIPREEGLLFYRP